MLVKWPLTIPQLTGDEPRKAYVYIPDEFKKYPDARYPVLYMFDGHNVFYDREATYGKSWGMLRYMRRTHTPMIIAAVECNHHPDGGRLSEYSPYTFDSREFGHIEGRGDVTMEWFVNEFKPFVDENFPTLPDREHTYIAGSSMGGLMSLYAVTAYNHVFSKAAALSPSLWCSRELDILFQTAPLAPDTVVYMDYGSEELKWHRNMSRWFTKAATTLTRRGVFLTSRIIPYGEHTEASWEKQVPFFMNILQYEIKLWKPTTQNGTPTIWAGIWK